MGIIVTVRHVREEMLCTRGMRAWLTHHGLSVSDFISNGLPVEQLEAIDDYFARRVAARARADAAAEGASE
jgi:hypothetical protein